MAGSVYIEHSTSHKLLWFIDSFMLINPLLRQAPNRQVLKKLTPTFIFKKTMLRFFLESSSACLPESVFQTDIFR
jgi:hypothetical protein